MPIKVPGIPEIGSVVNEVTGPIGRAVSNTTVIIEPVPGSVLV